jgi:hypothetical protein
LAAVEAWETDGTGLPRFWPGYREGIPEKMIGGQKFRLDLVNDG